MINFVIYFGRICYIMMHDKYDRTVIVMSGEYYVIRIIITFLNYLTLEDNVMLYITHQLSNVFYNIFCNFFRMKYHLKRDNKGR